MKDVIRPATAKDALSIHNLHTRSVRVLCSADYPEEIIEGWLQGRSPEGYVGIAKQEMYVCERDGAVVGFSHVRSDMLIALFVDPDYARQGIGRNLFEHARRIIRRHTSKPVKFESTLTAAPFYERCGCRRLRESTIRKNNVYVKTVWMALPERSEPIAGASKEMSKKEL